MRLRDGRNLGAVPSQSRRGHGLQISRPLAIPRLSGTEGGSLRDSRGGSAENGFHRLPSRQASVAGRGLDGGARQDGLAEAAHVGLRSPSGIVDARADRRIAELPRAGCFVGWLRQAHGLHAHRADAHHGASVFGIVGLPGDRILRAHGAFRRAGRFHVLRRPLPPGRHRRDRRLGAGAFSERRARPGVFRRDGALRACRSAQGRAQATGAR